MLLYKSYKYFLKMNIALLIMLNIVIVMIIQYIIQLIPNINHLIVPDEIIKLRTSWILYFFLLVVFIPIVETIIFQAGIIYLSKFILAKSNYNCFLLPVLISSIFFGFQHTYSLIYFITSLIVGFILALNYVVVLRRKENAIFITFLIHAILNLIAFSSEYISSNLNI